MLQPSHGRLRQQGLQRESRTSNPHRRSRKVSLATAHIVYVNLNQCLALALATLEESGIGIVKKQDSVKVTD